MVFSNQLPDQQQDNVNRYIEVSGEEGEGVLFGIDEITEYFDPQYKDDINKDDIAGLKSLISFMKKNRIEWIYWL